MLSLVSVARLEPAIAGTLPRGEDPEGQLSNMYFCGVAKMFLLHVCLDGVHIPKFYWHKNRMGSSPVSLYLHKC
jgi:hypothetical protein